MTEHNTAGRHPDQVDSTAPHPLESVLEKPDFVLLTGSANQPLARSVAEYLNRTVYDSTTRRFDDGEIRVTIPENLRRRSVVIIQPTSPPLVNDYIMELLFMIDAAKRASSREITAILPYFGYARQDRKDQPRVPISAAVVAKAIEVAGADRVVTVDLHSEQSEGFISDPWDNVYGSYVLVPHLQKLGLQNIKFASPDAGGVTRAIKFARLMEVDEPPAFTFKRRDPDKPNVSQTMSLTGDVNGYNVVLVDDMIDTGGTIVQAAHKMIESGALSVRVVATHGIFSKDALKKIDNSPIETVTVTDTILQREDVIKHPKVKVVSVAPLLGEVIIRIQTGESISEGLILQ